MAAAPAAELPVLHSFAEIAKKYGFKERSMREAANRGEFEHIRFGHSRMFTPKQLEAFLELQSRKPQRVAPAPRSRTRARVERERARRATATT